MLIAGMPVALSIQIGSAVEIAAQYIRGPRGGCYTIIRSCNKRYIDRSFCEDRPAEKAAASESRLAGRERSLKLRLKDKDGSCYELYSDRTWAIVPSALCAEK
jgi:hypothetical protein